MAVTYIQAIGIGFPTVKCHAVGAGDVYTDLIWDGGDPIPDKATLDQWILSNPSATSAKISVLAFRNRFTQTEKVTLEMASIDNPAGTMQQRQLAAMLRVMMADLAVAINVDLSRPDTRAGIQQLEAYGIIGAGRAAEILDTPPTTLEIAVIQ